MDEIITCWTASSAGRPFRVIPDGCRDLILIVRPDGSSILSLTGLDASTYTVNPSAGTRFVGIRLAPGCMAKWESEVNPNGQSALPFRMTAKMIQAAEIDSEDPFSPLVESVGHWFRKPGTIVRDFLDSIEERPNRIPDLTMSSRTLRRRLTAATGASPQYWLSFRRARFAATTISATRLPFAEIAFTSGYSDQAHMTREIRRWFAVTPSALRSSAEDYRPMFGNPNAFSNIGFS